MPLEGWDKLVISVIPIETGRAVAKTPRAVVKNGNCQWPDSIIESTRLVYDLKSKEIEEKKYKFVVSSVSVCISRRVVVLLLFRCCPL